MSFMLRSRTMRWLDEVGPLTVLLSVVAWLFFLPSLLGPVAGDYGVFTSVAERLLAGDSLYAGVWDNKDPLYFYLLAGSRVFAPWGPWLLEVFGLVLVAVGAVSLSRAWGLSWRVSVLIGTVCAPFILTGVADVASPAYPGSGFGLLAIAVAARAKWVWAGIFVALVLLMKVTLFPVVAAIVVTLLAWKWQWRNFARLAVGFSVATLLPVMFMALRSEFVPYLNSLLLNFSYAQEGASSTGRIGAIAEHLERSLIVGYL